MAPLPVLARKHPGSRVYALQHRAAAGDPYLPQRESSRVGGAGARTPRPSRMLGARQYACRSPGRPNPLCCRSPVGAAAVGRQRVGECHGVPALLRLQGHITGVRHNRPAAYSFSPRGEHRQRRGPRQGSRQASSEPRRRRPDPHSLPHPVSESTEALLRGDRVWRQLRHRLQGIRIESEFSGRSKAPAPCGSRPRTGLVEPRWCLRLRVYERVSWRESDL